VALIGLARHRVMVGTIVAAFFVVIFPGNVAQWTEGVDAFGLDTDAKRFARLFFQPVLVIWALAATGAWQAIRAGTWPTTPPAPTGEVVDEVRLGLAELASRIADDARGRSRYVFGVAGTPGSGKSTVAARLAAELGAVVVPMDGFHLDNTELDRLGLSRVKGAPETFDAANFVRLVEQLKHADGPVSAPSFDRIADRTIDGAITVGPNDRIVIVEGNYLLLETPPWGALRELFDGTGYIDVDPHTRVDRLVARHVRQGRSLDEAREFVRMSDEANAAIVAATRPRAEVVIDPARL
jgi:pantothenate kinase